MGLRVKAVSVSAAIMLTGACSTSGSGLTALPTRFPSRVASTTGSTATPSAGALIAAARNAMMSSTAVHVSGEMDQIQGTFDVRLGRDHAQGSLTFAGDTLRFIALPDRVYVKAPARLYLRAVPVSARAKIPTNIGKLWITAPVGSSLFAGVRMYSTKQDFLVATERLLAESNWTLGDPQIVNGVSAATISNPTANVTVLAHGIHYPVMVDDLSKGRYASLRFDSWNKDSVPSRPAANQVLDISRLGG